MDTCTQPTVQHTTSIGRQRVEHLFFIENQTKINIDRSCPILILGYKTWSKCTGLTYRKQTSDGVCVINLRFSHRFMFGYGQNEQTIQHIEFKKKKKKTNLVRNRVSQCNLQSMTIGNQCQFVSFNVFLVDFCLLGLFEFEWLNVKVVFSSNSILFWELFFLVEIR